MDIQIFKKNVKNVNLKVRPDGTVILTVPSETSDKYIQQILEKRKNWIQIQLDYFKKNYFIEKPKNYISGDSIKYLGREYRLKLSYSNREEVVFYRGYIYMYTTKLTDTFYKKKLLEKWYRTKATKVFSELIDKYLKIVKEPLNKITIRSMKTRWGSCNFFKKTINLNIKLIEKSKIGIEYVIFHELAHLKYPNHSKIFYSYLLTHMPDYQKRKNNLEKI